MRGHDCRRLPRSMAMLSLLVVGWKLHCFAGLTNSLGIQLVEIPAGSFVMGEDQAGDYDEAPAHQVNITKKFWISVGEISLSEFQQFRPGHACSFNGKATGLSWYDAQAFCEWLSGRENTTYRLPTEAEWEYACRAGTRTPFWSGDAPPATDQAPNPWKLKGTHDGVMEWCHDWHGPYAAGPSRDPVGPERGIARIIRGDKPDSDERLKDEHGRQSRDYHRSANRAALPPVFGSVHYPAFNPETGEAIPSTGACHRVGFRIVRAPWPVTKPEPAVVPFLRRGVPPAEAHRQQAPSTPYFRKRYLLPTPPDNSTVEAIRAAGFDRSFRPHNHSPAFEVCPNGDLLFVLYTSNFEYEPGVSLIGCRLRFGADEWDMPEPLFDLPDVNDHGPLLWTDWNKQKIYLFWGTPKLEHGGPPFLWTTSVDNGASWAELRMPLFNTIGPHSRQPINTAFRTTGGTLYVASDAWKNTSLLWATDDDGEHWHDTGGRTFGRHTTFCLLKDGAFLGLGGKSTDLGGYLPQSISRDRGKTWEVSPTPFAAQGVNQRPSLLRLRSGNLIFAGDFQKRGDIAPKAITERGCYVAVSRDDGQSWRIKKLPGAQPHERFPTNSPTLGYSVLRQGPNGMIHLVTTMNQPCLHFEFNEAWLLSDKEVSLDEAGLMRSRATQIRTVEKIQSKYPDGKIRIEASGGVADDGRFLLHGPQRWYFPNGDLEYASNYELGRKTGRETLRRADGSLVWEWQRRPDGISTWTRFWENGKKQSRSEWGQSMAQGRATTWDRNGKKQAEVHFEMGRPSSN